MTNEVATVTVTILIYLFFCYQNNETTSFQCFGKYLLRIYDILLRNPRGFGRQVIIDVAITGIDGQSRTSDDLPDRPLRVRHEQKKAKYGPTADRHNL